MNDLTHRVNISLELARSPRRGQDGLVYLSQRDVIELLDRIRELEARAAEAQKEAVSLSFKLGNAEATLRKCRNALTAGNSEEAAARNAHYWEPVIKSIDAVLDRGVEHE